MRTLVLGGTVFLSRAVAEAAQEAGHEVTCLARGASGSAPDGVRLVRADRAGPDAYDALADETFDAVVDVSNTVSHVRGALAALAGRAGHWTYVSTCNVYADNATAGQRVDTAPLQEPAPLEVDESDKSDPDMYGRINRACEIAVAEAMGADRSFLCRPGLIVGPGDRSVRFRYWSTRLARGGEVLAPGAPERPVQVIDVRDLADWIVGASGAGLTGPLDGIGAPMPMKRLLTEIAAGVGAAPRLTWVDQDFLVANKVEPWAGPRSIPLWLPVPDYAGFTARDVAPSLAAGLRTRPLADTARDTLDWERAATRPGTGGITADEEAELLTEWHLSAASPSARR